MPDTTSHRLFYATDVYGSGKATNFSGKSENFPVADNIQEHTFYIPWFKKFRPNEIDRYVEKFKLVIDNYKELLAGDEAKLKNSGNWALSPKNHKPLPQSREMTRFPAKSGQLATR